MTFPHHLVWSTDDPNLNNPVQRLWYIRQVLLHGRAHGRAEDIRTLDLREVAALLDDPAGRSEPAQAGISAVEDVFGKEGNAWLI